MLFISKTIRDRAISRQILYSDGTKYYSTSTYEKFRLFRFLGTILNFGGNGKCHLFSKTIRDRLIVGKFWTPRVPRTTPQGHLINLDFSKFQPPS